MIFSKENSIQVKGVAILCMIAYHLFSFPERILNDAIHSWFGSPITEAFQICVPIYLFIGGYGLQCIANKDSITWKEIIRRLYKLYISYWWVAIPFIIVGFMVGYYAIDLKEFLNNLSGLKSSYNGEWWFFSLYVELLILFYFISRIKFGWKRYLLLMTIILFITRSINKMLPLDDCIIYQRHLKMILIDLNIFMLGCFFSKFNIFDKLNKKYSFLFNNHIAALLLMTLPLIIRAYGPIIGITELFIVPMFVIGIVNICKIMGGGKIFLFLGKHSMNLWLIHSFFIYYYAKNVTFLTHNPTIMFFTILVISLGCSIVVEFLHEKINMILKSIDLI
jgi:hypothetical protein